MAGSGTRNTIKICGDNEKSEIPSPGQIVQLARRALEMMLKHGVVPHPRNFALWYAFCADEPLDLKAAIDHLITNHIPFTEKKCTELYVQYLMNPSVAQDGLSSETFEAFISHVGILGALDAIKGISSQTVKTENSVPSCEDEYDIEAASEAVDELALLVMPPQNADSTFSDIIHDTASPSQEMRHVQDHLDALRRDGRRCHVTGLVTRRIFEILLKESIVLASYYGRKLSVILMDVDNFRQFRGGFGERAGDQILRLIGRAISENVKAQDTVSRYDKKTFGVLLVDADESEAALISDAIRSVLAERSIVNRRTQDNLGQADLTLGIAEWHAGQRAQDVLKYASEALSLAKVQR